MDFLIGLRDSWPLERVPRPGVSEFKKVLIDIFYYVRVHHLWFGSYNAFPNKKYKVFIDIFYFVRVHVTLVVWILECVAGFANYFATKMWGFSFLQKDKFSLV